MKLWRDRIALTICGTTVSSYPTMPGNSVSPRWSLQIRLPRSSSLTLLAAIRSSEKLLLRNKASVLGSSLVWAMVKYPDLTAIVTEVETGSGEVLIRKHFSRDIDDSGRGGSRRIPTKDDRPRGVRFGPEPGHKAPASGCHRTLTYGGSRPPHGNNRSCCSTRPSRTSRMQFRESTSIEPPGSEHPSSSFSYGIS